MTDHLERSLDSTEGEGPSPEFVAALRNRIVAESSAPTRSGVAGPVTEIELAPTRENNMGTIQKAIIALAAAAVVAVGGYAAIGNWGDSDEVIVTDQPTDTTIAPSSTTTSEPTTTTTAQAFSDPAALVAEYIRVYEAADGVALRAITTRDFRYVGDGAQQTLTDAVRSVNSLAGLDWKVEPLSDLVITGTGPYEAELEHRITSTNYGPDGRVGTSTFTIVEDEGTLKVSRHVYRGETL
jgi:hypothetical protein